MARVDGYMEYPDDLTPGDAASGGMSSLLFRDGERGVAGHATFHPNEDDSNDGDDDGADGSLLIGMAVGAGLVLAGGWAVRKIKRTIHARTASGDTSSEFVPVPPTAAPVAHQVRQFTAEVEATFDGTKQPMSSAEAQGRLAAILLAAAFIAEQIRTLSNARIEPDVDIAALGGAIGKLTAQSVTAGSTE